MDRQTPALDIDTARHPGPDTVPTSADGAERRPGRDAAEVSVFESVAVAFEGDDFGEVDEAVDHGCYDDVAEDFAQRPDGLLDVTISGARS